MNKLILSFAIIVSLLLPNYNICKAQQKASELSAKITKLDPKSIAEEVLNEKKIYSKKLMGILKKYPKSNEKMEKEIYQLLENTKKIYLEYGFGIKAKKATDKKATLCKIEEVDGLAWEKFAELNTLLNSGRSKEIEKYKSELAMEINFAPYTFLAILDIDKYKKENSKEAKKLGI